MNLVRKFSLRKNLSPQDQLDTDKAMTAGTVSTAFGIKPRGTKLRVLSKKAMNAEPSETAQLKSATGFFHSKTPVLR